MAYSQLELNPVPPSPPSDLVSLGPEKNNEYAATPAELAPPPPPPAVSKFVLPAKPALPAKA
jgi:hypothetical protein